MVRASRPLGEIVSQLLPGKPPRRKGDRRPRPSSERAQLGQTDVEEFFPSYNGQRKPAPPRRKKPMPQNDSRYKRPKRKQPFLPGNPFKKPPVRRPSKHNKLKGNKFMPPSQIQHGFSPFFKGSLSYEDSRKKMERNKFESSVAAQQEEAEPPRRKRKRRPESGDRRPLVVPDTGPAIRPSRRPAGERDRPRRKRPQPERPADRPNTRNCSIIF